jgi:hypothetical protein
LRYVCVGSQNFASVENNWTQHERDKALSMPINFVWSCPPDPETDLKNFQREQAKYEAAYRRTREPLALYEALLHARAYLQLPANLDWLITAMGEFIMGGRTGQTAKQFKARMRHVQRYRCVRDLRRKGHKKERALDLAAAVLAATAAAAKPPTIEKSYDLVSRDLKRAKHESEFFYLVARSDPTRIPVHPATVALIRAHQREGGTLLAQ